MAFGITLERIAISRRNAQEIRARDLSSATMDASERKARRKVRVVSRVEVKLKAARQKHYAARHPTKPVSQAVLRKQRQAAAAIRTLRLEA